jgi:hypothetical protein
LNELPELALPVKRLGLRCRIKDKQICVTAGLIFVVSMCALVTYSPVWAMDFVHDQLAAGRKLRVRPPSI